MNKVSQHFTDYEFRCRCGQCEHSEGYTPSKELLGALEKVRFAYGPVRVNSGIRCKEHNAKVGGASKSQHLEGTAADIVVHNVEPQKIYDLLDGLYPTDCGLGNYDMFTHIDFRGYRARW